MVLEGVIGLGNNPVRDEHAISCLLAFQEEVQGYESHVARLTRQNSHEDGGIEADDHRSRSRATPRAMLSRIDFMSCRVTRWAVFPRTPNQDGISRPSSRSRVVADSRVAASGTSACPT